MTSDPKQKYTRQAEITTNGFYQDGQTASLYNILNLIVSETTLVSIGRLKDKVEQIWETWGGGGDSTDVPDDTMMTIIVLIDMSHGGLDGHDCLDGHDGH